ncbi:hypothetical protein BKA70DRAFT_1447632 [Coprinopsis sp. MPI-PUGE-AT-0042]|nr:hypothetical protein BKA70DRAFT_1447632 [Coprinopsis sp. MPI-PUGE-AT-0042]
MLARPVVPGPREREPHLTPPLDARPQRAAPPIHAPRLGHAAPVSFSIGGQRTDGPLVTIPRIKGHLALLNAFSELKQEVMECMDEVPQMPVDAEKRWAWFVNLSVERFDQWVRSLTPEDILELPAETLLPPVDILMVWHSYMLNPRWYAEDSERISSVGSLYALGNFCMKLMPHFPDILALPPSEARVDHFTDRLAIPFDPLTSASWHSSSKVHLVSLLLQRAHSPLYAGRWYRILPNRLQDAVSSCKLRQEDHQTTPSSSKIRSNTSFVIKVALLTCFPFRGISKYTAQPERDEKINSRIRARFLDPNSVRDFLSVPGVEEELCKKILEDCDYSLPKLRAKAGRSPARAKMMSAHLEPMVYSVELAGAAASWIRCTNLAGVDQGYFDAPDDERALQHALARYHAFLDLLSSLPSNFFVPTLDIDLVWHTHQLFASQYKSHCETYVGRFINHDDKVDTFKLSNAFDITCKAWKERFGIQYTYCGCPSSGGDTIGKRLSRFMAKKPSSPDLRNSFSSRPSSRRSRFYSRFPSGNPRKPTQRRHLYPSQQWLQMGCQGTIPETSGNHEEPSREGGKREEEEELTVS